MKRLYNIAFENIQSLKQSSSIVSLNLAPFNCVFYLVYLVSFIFLTVNQFYFKSSSVISIIITLVSIFNGRIMAEEYGYNRSGKKCKEKLENLYKYYKKTKQGKVGKHDGRHYRFFKQLEALYGDQGNNDLHIATQAKGNSQIFISGQNNSTHSVRTSAFNALQSSSMYEGIEFSLSISNDLDDSSSDEEVQDDKNQSLKDQTNRDESRLKELIEFQIRRLVEMQETWLNKISKRIEQLEQERISREEEWRRQEAARFELDQHMWNTEQARIKARDDIFIQALERISRDRKGMKFSQTGEIVMS
jgi:Myb/SANT-like DNA-binding domain